MVSSLVSSLLGLWSELDDGSGSILESIRLAFCAQFAARNKGGGVLKIVKDNNDIHENITSTGGFFFYWGSKFKLGR